MARANATKPYYNFIGGLNTDATGVSFPENCAEELVNFDIARNGALSRRLGLDQESTWLVGGSSNYTVNDSEVTTYVWKNASGTGDDILVVGSRNVAAFYKVTQGITEFSINYINEWTGLGTDLNSAISFAEYGKYLIATAEGASPIVLLYTGASINGIASVSIKTRDLVGESIGSISIQTKPATMSSAFEYNLQNQGWPQAKYSAYKTSTGVYPALTQVWYAGKDSSNNFSPSELDKIDFGTSNAPRGRVIFEINHDTRQSEATTIAGGQVTAGIGSAWSTTDKVSCCAAYAGRAFYGVNSYAIFGPRVYFTVISDSVIDVSKCYQRNDPTAEFSNELLENDGGYIEMRDAGTIKWMLPYRDSLLVFSNRGIWSINGGAGLPFTATSVSVAKISNVIVSSIPSIVQTEDSVFFLGADGMYAITLNSQANGFNVTNISDGRVSEYLSISGLTRKRDVTSEGSNTLDAVTIRKTIQGVYDQDSKKVVWLIYGGYNRPNKQTEDTLETTNYLLIYDIALNCFYTYTIRAVRDGGFVSGIVPCRSSNLPGYTSTDQLDFVDRSRTPLNIKVILTSHELNTFVIRRTFAHFTSTDFIDNISGYPAYGPVNFAYESSAKVSYDILQDASRKKQVTYLTALFNRTENGFIDEGGGSYKFKNPSGCYATAFWDWSDGLDNRKSGPYQIYRLPPPVYIPSGTLDPFDFGQRVIASKSKMRGSGRALQVKFGSEPGKDLQLIGWSIDYTGAGVV